MSRAFAQMRCMARVEVSTTTRRWWSWSASTFLAAAVIVDVAIDQGGRFETSRATTHAEPTYVVDGVVHYCVANMPGAVARTSPFALNNATIAHALSLAGKGWKQALKDDPHLQNGRNVALGQVTYEAVSHDLGYDYVNADRLLNLEPDRRG